MTVKTFLTVLGVGMVIGIVLGGLLVWRIGGGNQEQAGPTPPPRTVTVEKTVYKTAPASPPDTTAKSAQGPGGEASTDVLYEADWSKGLEGWSGVGGWKTLGGQLINDGSNTDENVWTKAPYQLGNIADYAVEADIQVVSVADPQFDSFGIVVRGGETTSASASPSPQVAGYKAGIDGETGYVGGPLEAARITRPGPSGPKPIAQDTFNPRKSWHLYRVEAEGNTIRFLIDGAVIAKGVDNTYLSGGQVGLWSKEVQLNVRSFKVIKL